ncbi:MAG: hypothetical protein ACREPB_03975 [Arenimonas sp.]
MSIDKLNSTAGIIAALRGESSDRGERTRRKKTEDNQEAVPTKRGDIKVLRQQLADLVKSVALDDKEAIRRVRPQMVRRILLWEFGATLRDHPDWQPMLETITQSIEAHPAHEASFLKLLSELKH